MMDIQSIEVLEGRYRDLVGDFQAGKIDDATFISEVDKLQLQDDYGRFWMIGTQTGSWHYYDGQNWHQADPREADNLPFMDEYGHYWQRGVKSGDWYYHQPETGEWVKPDPGDTPSMPPAGGGYGQAQQPDFAPYQTRLQPQGTDAGPGMPSQLDGELYQDDEGRYWAVGAKTGQWYFFDRDGWHPAHEFQRSVSPQYQQPYQPPTPPPYYDSQSYQAPPAYQQPPPGYAQGYAGQPQQPYQPQQGPGQAPAGQHPTGQPGQQQPAGPQQPAQTPAEQTEPPPQPASTEQGAGQMPTPPQGEADSGAWYYFDGEQWLRYSTGEPEEAPSPPPKMVIEQASQEAQKQAPAPETDSAQVKVESKDEPVVAEVFEEDEPSAEVVDVEVITVVEPEPEEEIPRKAVAEPEPSTPSRTERSTSPSITEEVVPRRSSRPTKTPSPRPAESVRPPRQPREQTSSRSPRSPGERRPSESGRPATPRKKETAHEPTIIIPTGATASRISSSSSTPSRETRPVKPAAGRERRARENTLPMEAVSAQRTASGSAKARQGRRDMTQPMPKAPSAATARAGSGTQVTPSARQAAQSKEPSSSEKRSPETQSQTSGYTLGDVLRSLPSTIWTFVGGVVLLLACALGLIFSWSWLQGDDLSPGGVAAVQSPTPTLDAGPPDATPTPGPTPTPAPEADVSPTAASLETFSSAALGFTVEYPEAWQAQEEDLFAVFSPSEDGLDPENLEDAAIWIGIPEDKSSEISELLTTVLSDFPADAETLNEGTISIASQTWTSAQIRFDDESLGGQGIATLAVTSKDGVGYYLIAVSPAEAWNATQPLFQGMINSFRFSTEEEAIAEAESSDAGEDEDADEDESEEGDKSAQASSTRRSSSDNTPTPEATATPLTYAIQSGDTLLEIAAKFGVDAELLASENNITDPEGLQLGQELIIPFTAEQLAEYNASGAVTQTNTGSPEESEAESAVASEAPAEEAEAPAAAAAPAPAPETEAESGEPAPVSGRIVYPAFNPGTNNYDLWLVDLATGEQSVIAGEASQPAFNRDGSLLAYRSWSLDSRGIFFRDFVGGRGGQVTRFVEDGLPTWAPDGYSFAFASRREGDRVPRIFIGNQLGEESYSIGFQGEYPATFPDGRLVVKGCLPSGDCGLYVMGGTGGGETKIGSPSDTAPAVSPDGSKIAFMSSGRGATNWEIWVMNPDGSDPKRLTDNGSNEGLPAWSPDGQSIAYVSDQGGSWAVWVMNADGSNQRKLFNMKGSPDGYVLHDKDNSKGWLEERISWAP